MALTREFRETVQARARRDPAFREALLNEATECFLNGEANVAWAILVDDIDASADL